MEALRNNLSTLQPSHPQKNRESVQKRASNIEIANRSCFETRVSWFCISVAVSMLAVIFLTKIAAKIYVDRRIRELDRKASLFQEEKNAQRQRECELIKKTVAFSMKNFNQSKFLQELKGNLADSSDRC